MPHRIGVMQDEPSDTVKEFQEALSKKAFADKNDYKHYENMCVHPDNLSNRDNPRRSKLTLPFFASQTGIMVGQLLEPISRIPRTRKRSRMVMVDWLPSSGRTTSRCGGRAPYREASSVSDPMARVRRMSVGCTRVVHTVSNERRP